MAIKRRKKISTRKKMDKAGNLISSSDKLAQWFNEKWGVLLFSVLVITGVSLISYTYAKNKVNRERNAYILFYKGMTAYHELDNDNIDKNSTEVYKLFEDVIKNFAGTRGARYAELYRGHLYYKEEKYEKALEAYKKLAGSSDKESTVNILAKEGLGYSYLALKRYKEAVSVFKEIIDSNRGLSRMELYLSLANAYEGIGDNDSTVEVLKKIIEEFPANPENNNIKERISTLSN